MKLEKIVLSGVIAAMLVASSFASRFQNQPGPTNSGTINAANVNPSSGLATAGSSVIVALPPGASAAAIELQGSGTGTLAVQTSSDYNPVSQTGDWTSVSSTATTYLSSLATGAPNPSSSGTYITAPVGGAFLRVTATVWTVGTSEAVYIRAGNGAAAGSSSGGGGGGGAVTAASGAYAAGSLAAGASVDIGTKADSAITNPASSASVIAALKGIITELEAALPAGSNLIGKIGLDQTTPGTTNAVVSQLDGGSIFNNGTTLTPLFAPISTATIGAQQLVAAVSSKKIKILAMFLWANGAVNVYVVDGAGSPQALIGNSTNPINLTAQNGFVLPFNPSGWQITSAVNVALNLNLSASVGVSGVIEYVTQ